jgi:hypothetical protein
LPRRVLAGLLGVRLRERTPGEGSGVRLVRWNGGSVQVWTGGPMYQAGRPMIIGEADEDQADE